MFEDLKVYLVMLGVVLFNVFFIGTNIIFSLINSANVFDIMFGLIVLAFVIGTNVIAGKYLIVYFATYFEGD